MKARMSTSSEGSEYFSVGSTVACTTCYKDVVEGEVVSFDPQTKMLILKSPSSGGPATGSPSLGASSGAGAAGMCDVFVLNLGLVSSVQVKNENNQPPPTLVNVNTEMLSKRAIKQLEEKKRRLRALGPGVSKEGQELFLAITKTITEVSWVGQSISVMDKVTISPPYKLENIRGETGCQAVQHIRKIVDKHLRDTAAAAAAASSSSVAGPSSGTPPPSVAGGGGGGGGPSPHPPPGGDDNR